jgi:hypothetical protein
VGVFVLELLGAEVELGVLEIVEEGVAVGVLDREGGMMMERVVVGVGL